MERLSDSTAGRMIHGVQSTRNNKRHASRRKTKWPIVGEFPNRFLGDGPEELGRARWRGAAQRRGGKVPSSIKHTVAIRG